MTSLETNLPTTSILILPDCAHPTVQRLWNLIGPAVMVHIPPRQKVPAFPWGHLKLADMERVEHVRTIGNGNVGVILGDVSGGLCSIDIDVDEEWGPFLALNPLLQKTFQTRGARGGNIWFRISVSCPTGRPLTRRGAKWGEFRGNGNLTVVKGWHQTGRRYRCNFAAPVEITLDQIVWPQGLEGMPRSEGARDGTTPKTPKPSISSYTSDPSKTSYRFPDEMIARHVPQAVHHSNDLLFKLAREVKTFERDHGPCGPADLRGVFERWRAEALPFLDAKQDAEDKYFAEFLRGYRCVKVLKGDCILERAWERTAKPLPPILDQGLREWGVTHEQTRKLAHLCMELQREFGDQPFFVSYPAIQRLFGVCYSVAWDWFGRVKDMKLIQMVEKATRERCARYRYLLPIEPHATGPTQTDTASSGPIVTLQGGHQP